MRLALAALALLLAACGHTTTVRAGHRPVTMDLATTERPAAFDLSAADARNVVPTTQRAGRDYRRIARPVTLASTEWDLPLLLRRIGGCESGGGPNGTLVWTAYNRRSGASGAFQYLRSTWNGYGGYSEARDAPPAVQVARAKSDFGNGNTRPWTASRGCWWV